MVEHKFAGRKKVGRVICFSSFLRLSVDPQLKRATDRIGKEPNLC
jgi:hypothetical protein